jgi:hypothetical protein
MTLDEFAAALNRLVADARSAGLSAEQLVEVLDSQSDAICAIDDQAGNQGLAIPAA